MLVSNGGSHSSLVGRLLEVESFSGPAEKMELKMMKRAWIFLSVKMEKPVAVV